MSPMPGSGGQPSVGEYLAMQHRLLYGDPPLSAPRSRPAECIDAYLPAEMRSASGGGEPDRSMSRPEIIADFLSRNPKPLPLKYATGLLLYSKPSFLERRHYGSILRAPGPPPDPLGGTHLRSGVETSHGGWSTLAHFETTGWMIGTYRESMPGSPDDQTWEVMLLSDGRAARARSTRWGPVVEGKPCNVAHDSHDQVALIFGRGWRRLQESDLAKNLARYLVGWK